MCGITGIYAFNEAGRFHQINLQKSIDRLSHRGPDAQGTYLHDRTGLGHRRLSIIDLSAGANQPMTDESGRYWIVYNGEIYNYKFLREDLIARGVRFRTQSDTEVLLYSFIRFGINCLDKINGFFAFAIFDQEQDELFIARDRFGIKPLYYFSDEDKLIFASELRSVLAYGVEKSINYNALYYYFQLNFIPAPLSIINGVHKLLPGNSIFVRKKRVEIQPYYQMPITIPGHGVSGSDYEFNIRQKLEKAVERRLVADVPVGSFLSGGIDSSIITGIASRMINNLSTFSIGYIDEPYFDETRYARIAARHFKTSHTEFRLSNRDLYEHLHRVLHHMDEPFADSSALPVNILSGETRKYTKVALSGDGGDELFAGYYKHAAFYRAMNPGLAEVLVGGSNFIWKSLPSSRNNRIGNTIRQLRRFAEGYRLPAAERYWFWASLNSQESVKKLLKAEILSRLSWPEITSLKQEWLSGISSNLESVLKKDLQFMLPNDMLYKLDHMSMAHGLEVRVPFLDHELVEYVSGIPARFKISARNKKIILKRAFSGLLPPELLERPKHGFEVPLLRWLRTDLHSMVNDQLLNTRFIDEQGIFDPGETERYKKRLMSLNPGDVHAQLWALIVFQSWWKNYMV